jgi:putative membrane protein
VIPAFGIAVAATLYALGMRSRVHRRAATAQAVWFASGLFVLALALASPIAAYDDRLLWVHMVQHVLLLTVAPPLILLGRPGMTSWRALPLAFRRRTARALAQSRWSAPLRWAVRALTYPPVALGVFVAMMAVWHLSALFNATLHSGAIHELEHALFFAAGLVLWSRLVDSPPLWTRLALPARAFYAFVAMVACTVLALVLGLASSPFYAEYSSLDSRPGGISALADQHIAAGIMWVPGSLSFVIAVALFAYRWLGEDLERRGASVAGAAT